MVEEGEYQGDCDYFFCPVPFLEGILSFGYIGAISIGVHEDARSLRRVAANLSLQPVVIAVGSQGYEYGEAGIRSFTETYGVLETITTIEPQENACSKAKITRRAKERPGASPMLFARFLMDFGALVPLEDISANLPPYTEEVVSLPMNRLLAKAYEELEQDIAAALQEHRGNSSVISTALNTLLLLSRPAVFDRTAT